MYLQVFKLALRREREIPRGLSLLCLREPILLYRSGGLGQRAYSGSHRAGGQS